jgi:hypothetical protein
MEETTSITDRIKKECRLARKDGVLFDSRLYESGTDDNSEAVALEDEDFKWVLDHFGTCFTTSVFIGKVNLLDGEHRGYKFCDSIDDLHNFIGRFPHIVIRQIGTRIFFTLIGYAERHEMELRRLSEEGRMEYFEDMLFIFTEGAFRFIRRNSTTFGKVDPHI